MAQQPASYKFVLAMVALAALALIVICLLYLPPKPGPSETEGLASGLLAPADVGRPEVDVSRITVKAWHHVQELEASLAQLPTVFWEPDDTTTLRSWMTDDGNLKGKRVLEIGPGTGLLSLCALKHGASHVVAIDINPYAVVNSSYNADRLGYITQLDARQLDRIEASPMTKLKPGEMFELVISNPPWEDAQVKSLDQYALYDPGMRLCEFLLTDTPAVLSPGGKLLLVYGARSALQRILERAPQLGWQVSILDDRKIESLPEVFVPGVLLELVRQKDYATP